MYDIATSSLSLASPLFTSSLSSVQIPLGRENWSTPSACLRMPSVCSVSKCPGFLYSAHFFPRGFVIPKVSGDYPYSTHSEFLLFFVSFLLIRQAFLQARLSLKDGRVRLQTLCLIPLTEGYEHHNKAPLKGGFYAIFLLLIG